MLIDGPRRRLRAAEEHAAAQRSRAKDIRRMIDELPSGLLGLRDRALITLGFAGGFPRCELVAFDGADLLAFVPEGLEGIVRRKTDQYGEGRSPMAVSAGVRA